LESSAKEIIFIFINNIFNDNRQGIQVDFVDCTEIANIEKSFKKNTRMIWIESPSNPTMEVIDLAKVSQLVKAYNSGNSKPVEAVKEESSILDKPIDQKVLMVVDNTFLTPYFQRPLENGTDIVIHSCTKYLNGASDVIMGSVCTINELVSEKLRFIQAAAGAIPSPFDCYLLQRSLR